jgi:hypothetical protein
MKVEVVKDKYGHFEIIVKKHKEIIAVSIFAEDVISLEPYYLVSDSSVEDDPSFIYSESVLTIHNNRNRIEIYVDIERNIGYNAIEDNHCIYSCKDEETDVNISFIIYHKVKKK